ncbi:MAG: Asp-tRNA(Asn)/Glu-tRNA(Gln) amidotransferase subunit GatC [Gammaproteobacteria bacterium]|nr:Asp-tRNA(Asn)/Glu-tRNA(Gln) amidotransferase subunit GatC [Gammaproteobacteria bacterium]
MLNAAQIEALSRLARIQLDARETAALVTQLGEILNLVERMNAVATDGVEPLAHPLEIDSRRRADEITEQDQRANLQHGAPATEAGYYLVPRVIE